jgi:hypothetical protein
VNAAVFAAYFADLLQRQEVPSGVLFPPEWRILHGRLFSYNSFTGRDTIVSASAPGTCTAFVVGSRNHQQDVSKGGWNRLRISTILRYYRGCQPNQALLFDRQIRLMPNLACFTAPKLTLAEFDLIAEKHRVSDDLQSALAVALYISLKKSHIIPYLQRNRARFPNLLANLLGLIGFRSTVHRLFVSEAVEHLKIRPDDVAVAVFLVNHFGFTQRFDKALYLVPLLRCAIELFPMAGIALANFCTEKADFWGSLIYLNAVGNASRWPIRCRNPPEYLSVVPQETLAYGPTLAESYLFNHPLSGLDFEYFAAVVKLFVAMGTESFCKLYKSFARKRPVFFTPTFEGWGEQIAKDNEVEWLFDPGIDCEEVGFPGLEKLPLADRFRKVVLEAEDALTRLDGLKQPDPPAAEFAIQLILGLRVADIGFLRKLLQIRRRYTALERMILIRASFLGVGIDINDVVNIKVEVTTITERNTLPLVVAIGRALKSYH